MTNITEPRYQPAESIDGGWTISFVNEHGRRQALDNVWYTSVRGEEGRARAAEYAAEASARHATRGAA